MSSISVYPSCTACLCIFFFKMLSLTIYRYIFVSVRASIACFWHGLSIFVVFISSCLLSFLQLFSAIPGLCLPVSSFVCRLLFVSVWGSCLSLAAFLSLSFISFLLHSVFVLLCLSFCYSMSDPLLCGSKTIALVYSTVYTYLLPGHLVGTEDDADPASPFYIVIQYMRSVNEPE